MTVDPWSGHCLCGAVAWRADGPPLWMGDCHCESCRRAVSGGLASFVGMQRAGFEWTRGAPNCHVSTPGVSRGFCGACGSPMSFESDKFPDEVHLYAATLVDPSRYRPEFAVHCAEAIGWPSAPEDQRFPCGYSDLKAAREKKIEKD